MKQPRQNITLKVAAGYAILACLFVLSTISVFRYTEALSRVSEAEERLTSRRMAAEEVILNLIRTGNLEQAVTLGTKSKDRAYFESVDRTLEAIARFRSIPRGDAQKLRLDTISSLVIMKRNNTLRLLEMMQGDDAARIYKEHIANLRSGADSAVVSQGVDRPVVSHEKTVVVEHSKKGFFSRLADVFRPSKRDTTMVSERTSTIKGDTLKSEVNISDAVASKLGKMADETSDAGRKKEARIRGRREELLAAGLEMTAKLQSVLRDVNKHERAAFNNIINKEMQKRKRAAMWTGCIAAIAVLLSCGSLFMVWHDVSRAREYRDQLEEAKQKAEELLKLRERLMLTVAHDIKSPAASISGFVEMSHKASPEERSEYIDNIGKASSHLLNLVTSLLDYNRLENGRVELNPVNFDLDDMITDIIGGFRPQALARGLRLEYVKDGNGSEHDCYNADIFRIRQVIENLLSNALKFTAEGSITLKAGVTDGELSVSVADTGPGMSEYDQQRIFSAFTRLSGAQGVEGVGLGLSISKELVTLLGGNISVKSVKGKGSMFSFSVPVEKAPQAANKNVGTPDSKNDSRENSNYHGDNSIFHGEKLRILLIDDDRLQRQLTHAMLLRLGEERWEVVACSSVGELFTYLNGSRFDLLLTDIEMPSMSGFEIMKHVRALNNENRIVPVVALTAHVLLDRNDFIKAGFADCLQKPFSMEQLREMAVKVLTKAHGGGNVGKGIRDMLADSNKAAGMGNYGQDKDRKAEANDSPAPLNLSALTTFADGDAQAETAILDQFREDTLNHEKAFSKAFEAGDKAEVCRLSHKMLPTFTLIGSSAISALTTMESRRGQSDWTDDDRQQCKTIMNGIKLVIEELDRQKAS